MCHWVSSWTEIVYVHQSANTCMLGESADWQRDFSKKWARSPGMLDQNRKVREKLQRQSLRFVGSRKQMVSVSTAENYVTATCHDGHQYTELLEQLQVVCSTGSIESLKDQLRFRDYLCGTTDAP